MFNSFISTLTMITMLLHAVFGCCTHHAHACEDGHADGSCRGPVVESAQETHHHGNHAGCDRPDDAADIGHHSAAKHSAACSGHQPVQQDTVALNDVRGPLKPEHSDAPCRRSCEGHDCSFTLASSVKAPSPDNVPLCFPEPASRIAEAHRCANGLLVAIDSGPPVTEFGPGCRPMTQVWRL